MHTFKYVCLGFFQVGITALANLTARHADDTPPRTFFSLEKVSNSYQIDTHHFTIVVRTLHVRSLLEFRSVYNSVSQLLGLKKNLWGTFHLKPLYVFYFNFVAGNHTICLGELGSHLHKEKQNRQLEKQLDNEIGSAHFAAFTCSVF